MSDVLGKLKEKAEKFQKHLAEDLNNLDELYIDITRQVDGRVVVNRDVKTGEISVRVDNKKYDPSSEPDHKIESIKDIYNVISRIEEQQRAVNRIVSRYKDFKTAYEYQENEVGMVLRRDGSANVQEQRDRQYRIEKAGQELIKRLDKIIRENESLKEKQSAVFSSIKIVKENEAIRKENKAIESAKKKVEQKNEQLEKKNEDLISTVDGKLDHDVKVITRAIGSEIKDWFGGITWLVIFLLTISISHVVILLMIGDSSEPFELTRGFVAIVFLKIVLLALLIWSVSIYKTLRHQHSMFKGRGVVVRTFVRFVSTIKNEKIQDAVTQEAAQAIFSMTETGFIKQKGDSGGNISISNPLRGINSGS